MMDVLTAQTVVVGVFLVAVVVWVVALLKFRKLRSLNSDFRIVQKVPQLDAEETRHNILSAIVARPQVSSHTVPVIDVMKREPNHIQLSLNESIEVDFDLNEQYGGTEVTATCDFTARQRKWILLLGQYITLVMPMLIFGLCAFMLQKVATAGHPAIRWQVIQSIHIGHFLWPPFLFIALIKHRNRAIHRTVDQLLLAAELQTANPLHG